MAKEARVIVCDSAQSSQDQQIVASNLEVPLRACMQRAWGKHATGILRLGGHFEYFLFFVCSGEGEGGVRGAGKGRGSVCY